ncbi:hypothetical protein ABT352_17415 [Streptosporangium sp. NPDC000563]|uniref:hypothetical protein n=1 Tax=Streptosporangium sp. NPDC000563 TaxID=3154366 RepID=UPI0033300F06
MTGEHWTENVAPGGEHDAPPGPRRDPVPVLSAPASRDGNDDNAAADAARARPRTASERPAGTVYEL